MDVSVFYGRTEELATLKQWIVQDNCRLVGLLGMGGIGKTALSVKFAQHVQHEFDSIIWRSLQHAPPVNDILATLIQILSNHQETPANLPESPSLRITRLIEYLRTSRCLLILDNAESILQAGAVAGQYRQGYEGYGEFIKRVGETSHRSCLILTSCEKPQELAALEGETLPVRSLELTGLHEEEARAIFQAKSTFTGTPEEWKALIQHYAGNPLALNIVASGIRDTFSSSISEVVHSLTAGSCAFYGITHLLERQFHRLTSSEQDVMYWLAINHQPTSFSELQEDIICPDLQQQLTATLKSLARKSIIDKRGTNRIKCPAIKTNYPYTKSIQLTGEGYCSASMKLQSVSHLPNRNASFFTLKPMVMNYVTQLVIVKICEEIKTGEIALFNSHALLKWQTEPFVINDQKRLILKPIMNKLLNDLSSKIDVTNRLNHIFSEWQMKHYITPNYTTINVINLQWQLDNA